MCSIDHKKAKRNKKIADKAKENEDPSKPKIKKRPLPAPRPVMANPYKKMVTVDREQDELADILNMVSAPRSPSPPLKRRKTLPVPSRQESNGTRFSQSTASSTFATSSDPVTAESFTSFADTGPSSDGIDLFSTSSSRHVNGAENILDHLSLNSKLQFEENDFSALDAGGVSSPDSKLVGIKQSEDDDDDDEEKLVVKAARKLKPAGGINKRQLVNTISMKTQKPPMPAPLEEDLKPVNTKQDAKKIKGMDWQLAAASVTLDAEGEEVVDEADVLNALKGARKFKAPSAGGGSLSSAKVQALEEDGSIRFYWLDYVENNGSIHFIGKVFDKESKKYVSSCVTVEGIDRNLYVLPRQAGVDG